MITFDNAPFGWVNSDIPAVSEVATWCSVALQKGTLAYLFLLLAQICTALCLKSVSLQSYVKNFQVQCEDIKIR